MRHAEGFWIKDFRNNPFKSLNGQVGCLSYNQNGAELIKGLQMNSMGDAKLSPGGFESSLPPRDYYPSLQELHAICNPWFTPMGIVTYLFFPRKRGINFKNKDTPALTPKAKPNARRLRRRISDHGKIAKGLIPFGVGGIGELSDPMGFFSELISPRGVSSWIGFNSNWGSWDGFMMMKGLRQRNSVEPPGINQTFTLVK
jgi:hypothetical protein